MEAPVRNSHPPCTPPISLRLLHPIHPQLPSIPVGPKENPRKRKRKPHGSRITHPSHPLTPSSVPTTLPLFFPFGNRHGWDWILLSIHMCTHPPIHAGVGGREHRAGVNLVVSIPRSDSRPATDGRATRASSAWAHVHTDAWRPGRDGNTTEERNSWSVIFLSRPLWGRDIIC